MQPAIPHEGNTEYKLNIKWTLDLYFNGNIFSAYISR